MGKFDFISDTHTRTMISNGYSAVSQLELWEWMRNFSTSEYFMRTKHPNAYRIIEKKKCRLYQTILYILARLSHKLCFI